MKDWFSGAAQKFKAQDAVEQRKVDRSTQEKQILDSQVPKLWADLCQYIRQQIKGFNEEVGREVLVAPVTSPQKLSVFAKTATGQHELELRFDQSDHTVSYASPKSSGRLAMTVTTQNTVLFATSDSVNATADDTGAKLLDLLMKI